MSNYFEKVITLQTFFMMFVATIIASLSLNKEQNQKTWDFVYLTPYSYLKKAFGKSIGVTLNVSLTVLLSIPIALFCWLYGGVTIFLLFKIYLLLIIGSFTFSCIGVFLGMIQKKSIGSIIGVVILFYIISAVSMGFRSHNTFPAAVSGLIPPMAYADDIDTVNIRASYYDSDEYSYYFGKQHNFYNWNNGPKQPAYFFGYSANPSMIGICFYSLIFLSFLLAISNKFKNPNDIFMPKYVFISTRLLRNI